jgi:hypothetical protein
VRGSRRAVGLPSEGRGGKPPPRNGETAPASRPRWICTGHLYPGEMDRYADRLSEAATSDDAAKMRPDDDEDDQDEK